MAGEWMGRKLNRKRSSVGRGKGKMGKENRRDDHKGNSSTKLRHKGRRGVYSGRKV